MSYNKEDEIIKEFLPIIGSSLHPLDEAELFYSYHINGWTIEEISDKYYYEFDYIQNRIFLHYLIPEIKKLLINKEIPLIIGFIIGKFGLKKDSLQLEKDIELQKKGLEYYWNNKNHQNIFYLLETYLIKEKFNIDLEEKYFKGQTNGSLSNIDKIIDKSLYNLKNLIMFNQYEIALLIETDIPAGEQFKNILYLIFKKFYEQIYNDWEYYQKAKHSSLWNEYEKWDWNLPLLILQGKIKQSPETIKEFLIKQNLKPEQIEKLMQKYS